MHAVMGIVYGAFLAFLIPQMIGWSKLATGFGASYHGFPAWILLMLASGVCASGIRDLIANARRGGVTDEFRHYRRWFYGAAIYNAVWGAVVVLFPGTLLRTRT